MAEYNTPAEWYALLGDNATDTDKILIDLYSTMATGAPQYRTAPEWKAYFVPLLFVNDSQKILVDILSTVEGGTGGAPTIEKITAADFTGNDYTNAALVGKTADIDFLVYSDGGSGTLMSSPGGYTFDDTTGTISTIPDNYRIIIY